jgi:hypothetical protein
LPDQRFKKDRLFMVDEDVDLDRLLTCDADELAEFLSDMSVAQCESAARAILDRVGGPRFERYLQCIAETMAPPDGGEPPETVEGYYHAVRSLFPHVDKDDGTLGRLCAVVLQLCLHHLQDETGELDA